MNYSSMIARLTVVVIALALPGQIWTLSAEETSVVARSDSAQAIHDQLEEINLDIRHWQTRIRKALQMGKDPWPAMPPESQSVRDLLEHLEGKILGLESEDSEVLLRKVRALRIMAENVRMPTDKKRREASPPAVFPEKLSRPVPAGLKAAPANDDCVNALPIGFGTYTGSTVEATNDGEASCGSALYSPDVWFRFTASAYGSVHVDTLGSDYDTVLSIHTDCPGALSNQTECNDDSFGLTSSMSFYAYPGTSYLIRVSGFHGATGSYVLNIDRGATLTGSVTEAISGDPLEGISVVVMNSDGYHVNSDSTDASGVYVIDGLPSDTYYVATSSSPDHIDELYDDVSCADGPPTGCSVDAGTPVVLANGTTTGGIDFVLDRGGAISGSVVDSATGVAPPGSTNMRLYDGAGAYISTLSVYGSDYTVGGLEPGTYYLLASHSGYVDQVFDDLPCPGGSYTQCDATTGTPIAVALNSVVAGVDFSLQQLGSISGVVANSATAGPISGCLVTASNPTAGTSSAEYSDSGGVFLIGGLNQGDYYVKAACSGYVDELYDDIPCEVGDCTLADGVPVAVTTGGSTAGIDFALDPFGSIAGVVTEEASGALVQGIYVELWDEDGFYERNDYVGSLGDYSMAAMPGTHFVVADASQKFFGELYDGIDCAEGAPASCDVSSGTPVVVPVNTSIRGVDFDLSKRPVFTGVVSNATTGLPISGIEVVARLQSGAYEEYAFTGADGVFEFFSLDEGPYYFVTENADYKGYQDQLYEGIPCAEGWYACDSTQGTLVEDPEGDGASGIDFNLTALGSIEGTVRLLGQPIRSVDIDLYSVSGFREGSAYTDSDGRYSMTGLDAGDYYVVVEGSSTYLGQLYNDVICPGGPSVGCEFSDGTVVSVELDTVAAGIDFALDPAGTISGSVVDQSTGAAISGAIVRIWSDGPTRLNDRYSGYNGEFKFSGLAPGDFFLTAAKTDYVGELYSEIPCGDGWAASCDQWPGTPVSVSLGADVTGIEFTLLQRGSISGRVTASATGAPIDSAQVEVYSQSGSRDGTASSDSTGFFKVSALDSGDYFVVATKSGYIGEIFDGIAKPEAGFDPTVGHPVSVSYETETRHIDFSLEKPITIFGLVTDETTGATVTSGVVSLWNSDGSLRDTDSTNWEGGYSFSRLAEGSYFLSVSDPNDRFVSELYDDLPCPLGIPAGCDPQSGDPIIVSTGDQRRINFALVPNGGIKGVVRSQATGIAIRNIPISAVAAAGGMIVSASTSSSGEYRLEGLPAGTYYVYAPDRFGHRGDLYDAIPCPGGPPSGCTVTDGTPVVVNDTGLTSGIDFSLDRWGVITGSVTDAATGASVNGEVEAYRVGSWQLEDTADSSIFPGGLYELNGLEPGDYVILAREPGYTQQLYDGVECPGGPSNGACDFSDGTVVTVSLNVEMKGVDFSLSPSKGVISGTVFNEWSGLPVRYVYVELFREDGSSAGYGQTDESGAYRIESLEAATYFVATDQQYVNAFIQELYDDIPCFGGPPDGCDPTKGTPVVVPDSAEVSGVDFSLVPMQSGVRGVVTDAVSGTPLLGVLVDVWRRSDRSLVTTVAVSPSGVFFAELDAGVYNVSTANADGYIDEVWNGMLCIGGSAFSGACDPKEGRRIDVEDGNLTDGIDFHLDLYENLLFIDGFESGDTSMWLARTGG